MSPKQSRSNPSCSIPRRRSPPIDPEDSRFASSRSAQPDSSGGPRWPKSQVRAKVQSRSAVRRLIPRARAACSMVSPANRRSLTSAAACASVSLSRVIASSRSIRSSASEVVSSRSDSRSRSWHGSHPPASAACGHAPVDQDPADRLGRRGQEVDAIVPGAYFPGSTNRRYASWTKAVAWSVWPGFSRASFCAASLRSSP